jgi:hypothetical protein
LSFGVLAYSTLYGGLQKVMLASWSSSALDVRQHRGVTAQQPVGAQEPEVAGICDRILGRLGNPSSASSDPASLSASASNRSICHIETDQIEIEALVAQQSQPLLNQGTRHDPLTIRVGNCVVQTWTSRTRRAPRQEKRAAFTSAIY